MLPENSLAKGSVVACTRKRCLLVLIALAVTLTAALSARFLYGPRPLYRVTILPSLGQGSVLAFALNDREQVVCVSYVGSKRYLFLWDRESGMQSLGLATPRPR